MNSISKLREFFIHLVNAFVCVGILSLVAQDVDVGVCRTRTSAVPCQLPHRTTDFHFFFHSCERRSVELWAEESQSRHHQRWRIHHRFGHRVAYLLDGYVFVGKDDLVSQLKQGTIFNCPLLCWCHIHLLRLPCYLFIFCEQLGGFLTLSERHHGHIATVFRVPFHGSVQCLPGQIIIVFSRFDCS